MDRISPARTALIVVDMQNDFCAPGGRADLKGRDIGIVARILPTVAGLLAEARTAGCRVVYLQNTTEADGSLTSPADRLRRAAEWGPDDPFPTVRGSWGHRILDEIAPQPGDHVIEKVRQSGFVATRLDLLLRAQAIRTLLFTGVATHACVEATLRDAMNRDFEAILVEDGVAALEPELHAAGLAVMRAVLPPAWVVRAGAVVAALRREGPAHAA